MEAEIRRTAFRDLAKNLQGIDLDVYRSFEADPLEPIIGQGDPLARIALFGRDPGRDEVKHGIPFIGAGGQKVRQTLHEVLYGTSLPDFQASVDVGSFLFWANTVPYKPVGNKAWSQKVKKAFQPLMADVLVHSWHGADIITLGREAFLWFGINQTKTVRDNLMTFWQREDRFEQSIAVSLEASTSARTFRLHPLPHPSPLNAVWYRHFPRLLEQRLRDLGLSVDDWRLENEPPTP